MSEALILKKIKTQAPPTKIGVIYKNVFIDYYNQSFSSQEEYTLYQEIVAGVQDSTIIIDENEFNLKQAQEEKLQKLKFDYQNIYQRAILLDGINFILELHDESGNFTLLQTVSSKGLRSVKRVYVKVLKINEDGSLSPYKAKLPIILVNEIFNILNDYSVNNYDIYNKYKQIIENFNNFTDLESLIYQVNDFTKNDQIQEGFFTKNIKIDIDGLIDALIQKTDQELLALKYHNVDIQDFKTWYAEIKDTKINNRYQIFKPV